jgi:hypothetical protein
MFVLLKDGASPPHVERGKNLKAANLEQETELFLFMKAVQ